MKKLSIFVDESGDFGKYDKRTEFYIISFIIHDQNNNIEKYVERLKNELNKTNYVPGAIHSEPLIRKESPFEKMSITERRDIFRRLFFFFVKCPVKFKTFVFPKKMYDDVYKLQGNIVKSLNEFLFKNRKYFNKFDEIIVYYDNGQQELTKILNTVFALNFNNYVLKKVLPINYFLFQVADMICSIELTNEKLKLKGLINSDRLFFGSRKEFIKFYYKSIIRKKIS